MLVGRYVFWTEIEAQCSLATISHWPMRNTKYIAINLGRSRNFLY